MVGLTLVYSTMRDRNDDDRDELSRRDFVAVLGATGATAALAGCGGNGSNKGTTSKTGTTGTTGTSTSSGGNGGSGKLRDDTLTLAQWDVPSNCQYNPYNPSKYPVTQRMLFDRFMRYNLKTDKYHGYAVSKWSINGQTVTLTARNGLTWHDGSSVTAKDLVAQLKLDMYTGGSLAQYVGDIASDVHTTGKRTVQIDLSQKVNKNILLQILQPKRLAAKSGIFMKYVNKFDSASSSSGRTKVQSTLSKMKLSKPVGNGPFKFDSANSNRTLLTKYDKHPDAGKINFPKVEYKYLSTNQKRWEALINNETDGSATLFVPKNVLNKLPKTTEVARIPRDYGMGVLFQFSNTKYKFSDFRVRAALMYALDRSSIASNSGAGTNTKVPVNIPCGLTGNFSGKPKQRLGSDASVFNKYSTDTSKAASLLKNAGFSKSGGTWKTPSGDTFAPTLKCPSGFTDWVAACKTIVSQLKTFGIKARLVTKSNSTYWGQDYVNGNWDLAVQGWASYSHSYPWFHFNWLFNSKDAKKYWNVPKTVNVPPYAKPNGSPSTTDPIQAIHKLSHQSGSKANELIKHLAWVVNQSLPVLPIQEKLAQSFLTTDDWNVPKKSADSIQVYWPTGWLPREGKWTAKTQ